MANRIKGITVEINGDTTKLTDALKNVNRTISNTQSQLKDVEKLLKLDPTNTELLAQKQSLLTNAVSATSEKLDALRSTAQQAFTQLQDGRITQQQFDALQREIIDTEQSLRDYQRQLEELSDSSDDLDEALNDTANGADDADDSMKNLNKTADKTEGSFSIAKGAVATFVGNALTSLVSTSVDAAQTVGELSDSTMEFRENLAKLQTTAESAGYSTEYASGAFSEMYGVLGDETAATTTISNFMKLETSTDSLNNLLNSATGIWAVYGDSIPLDGLHPPPGTVSTSSYAGMDGSYLNNAFIEKRNLVISFEMRGVGLEKRRHALYRVVKPSRYIKVFYKTAGIDVYTEGYVETCEIDNFTNKTNGQISILCPDPYWYSTSAIHACYSRVSGVFFFPFPQSDAPFVLGTFSTTDNIEIRNDGDETGFIIQIEAMTDVTVPEVAAVTPTIYNADTGEYLQIKGEILRGDIITISTKTGNKTVTLTRNGVDSNIINRLVAGSTWLTLREGLNTFHVQAVRNVKNLKITLMHTNAYLGV